MTKFFTYYWVLFWLILGFGVPESWALYTGHAPDTLSDTVWRVFNVNKNEYPIHWSVLHFLLACFMVWLTGHFVFRIWR